MQPMDFIKSIDLKHCDFNKASVPYLQRLVDKSTRLRMAVAFWTIKPEVISLNLSKLLSQQGSFACVDVHEPTNIDHICDLSQDGANMFFHGKTINEKKKPDGSTPKLPTNLLHSKIMLFDISEHEAELIVGSHNWTEYALSGINIETSLRVKLDKASHLYSEAEILLDSIRNQCSPVNPFLRDVYKSLQKPEMKVPAVTLLKHDDLYLPEKAIIHIFGTNLDDFKSVNSVGDKIYVTIKEIETGREELFKANIFIAGYLPKEKPEIGWTTLEEGYWALHMGEAPLLQEKNIPEESFLIDKAYFWTTIVLYSKLSSSSRLDPPREIIPLVASATQINFQLWPQERGWVHPDRKKAPVIKEIPFAQLERYQPNAEERLQLIYGDSNEETIMNQNQQTTLQKYESDNMPELLETTNDPQPLIRKLVLRNNDE